MRKKNSIKNVVASMGSNLITIIIGLVSQAIFIKILGEEYLGLNGLFSNVISMLGIVELGIGSAIIYNLYRPLANNNIEEIKSLMKFYKKSYHIIAIIVAIVGILIIPLLQFIVDIKSITIPINVYMVYILFLIDIACSYLLSYKRSILYASQQNYVINIIHIAYTILLSVFQLLFLFFTKNYYLYLIIKIVMRILENIIITRIANKKYIYLLDSDVKDLDKKIEKDIFKKVKALFFHKIGAFVVLGSDNIIISKFLGLAMVGLYSNYYLIINAVQTLFSQALVALTPSVGNLLVTENKDKVFDVFKKVRFMNFWIATFASVAILVIMQSFIRIWIGEKYLLTISILVVLVLNLYQKLMRSTYGTFKEAAGIYYEDRYVPLVESVLNIVVSIVCCKFWGLTGVFIGTIVSGFALWCYSYPKYVYKKLFGRSYIDYAKETMGYIFLFLMVSGVTYYVSLMINFNNIYLEFFSNVFLSLIIPNFLLFFIFFKTNNFKYYWNLLKR